MIGFWIVATWLVYHLVSATTTYDCSGGNSIFINDPSYSVTCCSSSFSITFGTAVRTVTPISCSRLTSVTLSDSVTAIAANAFQSLSLTSFTFGNNLRSIGAYAFSHATLRGDITIPDSVQFLGDYAFEYSNMSSITFGSGLSNVSYWAFSNSFVPTVIFSDSIEVIVAGAFFGSSVKNIVWGTGLKVINDAAFDSCHSLTSVVLPEGLTTLGVSSFAVCSNLVSVTLPESLTYIGDMAFEFDALTSISIPDAVKTISAYAFYLNVNLTCVLWNTSISRSVDRAFEGCPLTGCSPSSQPSYKPSGPTYQPSISPSLSPTTYRPTTCRPTIRPSMLPTEIPTAYPTSRPTHVECPLGFVHDFQGSVDTPECHFCQCKPCQAGQYAPLHSMRCIDSPAGYYSPINATDKYACPSGTYSLGLQSECFACPAGYYLIDTSSPPVLCPPSTYSAAGDNHCTACPSGIVSNAGATSVGQCVSPKTSFGIAFVGLLLSLLGFFVYIVGGRLHRMAFKRRQNMVRKCSIMYNKLCDIILALRDHYRLYAPSNIDEKLFYWVRIVLVAVCASVVILMFVFVFIYQTFYTCVIIYRGYVHLPNVGLPSLTRRFELYISVLEGFSFSVVRYLSYPFKYILNFLATLSIDFSGAQVSCIGAQIPMQLLANVLVIAVIVLVIESDMEVFWCSAFSNVHQEFRKLLIRPSLWENRILTIFKYMMWSICLQVIPHPRSLLQFVIGFFSLVPFFDDNYHAKHSPSCDVGSYYKVDSLLAYSSTAVAYIAILPLLLIFSQILVPRFMIDRGGVKPKRYIQKRLLKEGSKCVCGLPLIRHRTMSVEGLKCCNSTGCPYDRPDFSVFYGCPRYKKCRWVLCRSCGNSTTKEILFTVEYARSLVEGTADGGSSTMQSSAQSGRVPMDRSKTMTHQDLSIIQSHTTIAGVSKTVKWYSPTAQYLKYLGSLVALDWLYCRFAYSFGRSLVPILDPASYNYGRKLPWIAAYDDYDDEYEHLCLELEWTFIAGTAATYYRLVRTVQEDLTPPLKTYITCSSCELEIRERCYYRDIYHYHVCSTCEAVHDEGIPVSIYSLPRSWPRYLLESAVYLISYTPMAQLCSERGRLIWRQVMLNYMIYLRAAVGWWSELETLNFGLMDRFTELIKNDAILTHRNIFDPTPVLDKACIEDENIQVMSAVVSSRLVLMQMIPYMTLFSAIAVNLCSCPILLRDSKLMDMLPPLFVVSDLTQMAKETLMDVGILPTWQVQPMCVYLFVRRSRGVQYLLNALTSIVAVIIVFSTDVKLVTGVMVFSLTLIAIQGAVASIFPIVLVHYLLFPSEKVIHCEVVHFEPDDDEEEANEKDIDKGSLVLEEKISHQYLHNIEDSFVACEMGSEVGLGKSEERSDGETLSMGCNSVYVTETLQNCSTLNDVNAKAVGVVVRDEHVDASGDANASEVV